VRPAHSPAVARDQRDAGALLRTPVEKRAALHRGFQIEESRCEDQDQVARGESHIVDHDRLVDPGHRCRAPSHLPVRAHNRPRETRALQGVAEDHHLPCSRIRFRVGGDSGRQTSAEGLLAKRLQLWAHPERALGLTERHQPPAVPYHADIRHVLERVRQFGPDLLGTGRDQRFHTAPQRTPGCLLRPYRRGAHETIPVAGPPLTQPHAVHHPVAVDRVQVGADRCEAGIRPVAQVHTVQVSGQLPDHLQSGLVHLFADRGEAPAQMRHTRRIEVAGVPGRHRRLPRKQPQARA
jgi:hypothetical protein